MTTAHEPTSAPVRTGAEVVVSDLTWRPFGRTRPVLPGINLRLEPGQKVLLAGPSGSGKSTLLRSLAGLLLTADSGDLSGSVTIDGQPPEAVAGQVGLVLQDPGAGVVASTIGRDVAFGLENLGLSPADIPAKVRAALDEVGLGMSAETSPMSLSGGQLQRLALAGALVMGPSVLLLDEPTAMLDAQTAALVREVVLDVVDRHGLTLVIVEHRLDGWVDHVDRLIVLDSNGSITADGAAADVLAEQGESLAAQGIWVPGAPEPTPVDLDLPALTDATAGRVPRGDVVAAASDIVLERRSRSLSGPVRATLALDGVTDQVAAGEALALVGPSGSGKSSLLSVLGGLIEPTSGTVEFADPVRPRADGATTDEPPIEWRSKDVAAVISWVPQRAASTIVAKTVRDEVLATPRAIGLPTDAAEARADALLVALGLDHLATVDPRQLSGGEQRRLAVASAIAQAPALVLADEPTVGQDRLTWAAVIGVLRAARAEGSAVVAATHDQGVIDRAERVTHLTAPAPPPLEPERRQPLLARVGPLALLAVGLGVLPLPALLQNWRQGLLVLCVEIVLGLIGLWAPGRGAAPIGRLRSLALRLAPAGLAVLGVGWSAWLLGGRDVEIAVGASLRVLCLVLPSAFVVGFIDPEELGDHLAQRLHLPARPVVAATAALQRLQSFDALWNEIMSARRARGIRADRGVVGRVTEAGAVTVGLLIGAIGQAASLALAMDARGFAGAHKRSWTGPAPWRLPDTLAVLAILLVIATAATARLLNL